MDSITRTVTLIGYVQVKRTITLIVDPALVEDHQDEAGVLDTRGLDENFTAILRDNLDDLNRGDTRMMTQSELCGIDQYPGEWMIESNPLVGRIQLKDDHDTDSYNSNI